jgi:hypothetical protein
VERTRGIGWSNHALALALAIVLGALWLRNGWPLLRHGVLPDSDDMVRMAQIRDWIGGQAFTDLTQHRLGIGGSGTLHWSRLGDFGVAGLILVLRPLLGAAQAEIWAAILWPAMLFAVFLIASARLARALGTPSWLAIVIAAFAFPAITMFVPGRIDHHGLQIVLVLILVESLLRDPTARSGAITGLTAAVMLAIGLETAPFVLLAIAVLGLLWIVDGKSEAARLAGFGLVLGGATLIWFAVARTDVWPAGWCDGFTPASSVATVAAALACILLALITPRLPSPGWRFGAGLFVAAACAVSIWPTASVCVTGPYGPVDPVLARLWLANVEEARGLFADSTGKAMAFGGLAVTGLVTSAVIAWRTRGRGWFVLLAFQAAALLVALLQLRGTAIAAALAPAALAALVAAARARGNIVFLVGAWLASAGLAWSVAGRLVEPAKPATATAGADCTAPETLAQLATLRPGLVISPVDAGAYLLGATRHRVLAAPYHRNNAGNRAAYDFWQAPEVPAAAIALQTNADYVLSCPDAFGGIALPRDSMAVRLAKGDAPGWLVPVPLEASAARLYRVLPHTPAGR